MRRPSTTVVALAVAAVLLHCAVTVADAAASPTSARRHEKRVGYRKPVVRPSMVADQPNTTNGTTPADDYDDGNYDESGGRGGGGDDDYEESGREVYHKPPSPDPATEDRRTLLYVYTSYTHDILRDFISVA